MKVIADAETDELLGVHMIGAHVTELIAEASVGMLLEATAWEVGSAVHPHPTALGDARRGAPWPWTASPSTSSHGGWGRPRRSSISRQPTRRVARAPKWR